MMCESCVARRFAGGIFMRIAVCDDQLSMRKQLCSMLESYFNRCSLYARMDDFHSAEAFLAEFKPGKYQMVFLDIYMPGITGIALAARIRETDRACELVFTTCSPDHAMESYAFYTAGYLLKPYTERQLYDVMDWCMMHPSADLPTLSITCRHERITLLISEIVYFEIFGRECSVHTQDKTLITNRSLSEFEGSLTPSFLRCHRSFLINMDYVAKIDGGDFLLAGGARVPISAETAPRIKQSYFDYMFRKTWEGR